MGCVPAAFKRHITITWHTLYPAAPLGRHEHLAGWKMFVAVVTQQITLICVINKGKANQSA